ncbi:hypothetical protein KK424_00510 [Clostridioides difficile]|nr:hypothetical protein [Clostridioides difficile]
MISKTVVQRKYTDALRKIALMKYGEEAKKIGNKRTKKVNTKLLLQVIIVLWKIKYVSTSKAYEEKLMSFFYSL